MISNRKDFFSPSFTIQFTLLSPHIDPMFSSALYESLIEKFPVNKNENNQYVLDVSLDRIVRSTAAINYEGEECVELITICLKSSLYKDGAMIWEEKGEIKFFLPFQESMHGSWFLFAQDSIAMYAHLLKEKINLLSL